MLDQVLEEYAERNPGSKMLVVMIPIAGNVIPAKTADDETIEVFIDTVEWSGRQAIRAAAKALILGENEELPGYE